MPADYDEFLSRDWRTFSSLDSTHRLMSRYTGNAIGEHEALAQRIATILATPKGSRVWLREFGSDLPRLVDTPINEIFKIKVYAATSEAIERWEPLFQLVKTELTEFEDGKAEIILHGNSLIDGQVLRIGDLVLDLRNSPVVTLRDSL